MRRAQTALIAAGKLYLQFPARASHKELGMEIQMTEIKNSEEKNLFNILGGLPFTRRGAWFGIFADMFMRPIYGTRLFIGSRRGSVIERGSNEFMKFFPMYRGEKTDYEILTSATELILRTAYGDIRCLFAAPDLLYFKGEKGLSLRLEKAMPQHEVMKKRGDKGWEQLASWLGTLLYYPVKGSLEMKADWDYETLSTPLVRGTVLPDEDGEFLLAVQESQYDNKVRPHYPTYEEGLRDVTADWQDFVDHMPKLRDEFAALQPEALYTEWSFIVNPSGRMEYPLIFMTGNAFASSWQMIQNAVAFKDNIPLRNAFLLNYLCEQAPSGQLPDFFDDARSAPQGLKSPIQGWGLKWIMKDHDLFAEMPEKDLLRMYQGYGAWADWFMKYRDDDHDGLPECDHGDEHMDDATTYVDCPEIESPDQPAYLILLYEALGDLAGFLGKTDEQVEWYRRKDEMLALLIRELWNGEMFIARTARTHEPIISGSLVHYMPLVLGKRLPQEIIDKMTSDIMEEGVFLTQYGLASERLDSEQYRIMGFARGFVRPPWQLLLLTGMYDAGKIEEAKMIATRYCLAMKDNGFHLLIDPREAGRSSFACSWPTCVFLILADMVQNK